MTFENLPAAVSQLQGQLNRIEKLLTKPLAPEKPQRFDFTGVLGYINESGFVLSQSKLQKLCATGKIPSRKFNNRHVFEKCEIDKWVESQTFNVSDHSEAAYTLVESANLSRKLRGGKAK